MAGSLNKVSLIGNVGRDPEIRSMSNGGKVANLSLATSETWTDRSGEKKEATEWHRVVVFQNGDRGLVDVIDKYVKKGSKLYIEGTLKTRKYEKDGQDHYATEVVLTGFGNTLILLGEKGGGGSDRAASQEAAYGDRGNSYARARDPDSQPRGSLKEEMDDEIPF